MSGHRSGKSWRGSFSSRSGGIATQRKPLAQLWARAGGRCWVCRRPVELAEATREHKLPALLGGRVTWANLSISHRDCNERRLPRLKLYAQVFARAACCRMQFPRRALLRCYADPAPILLSHMAAAVASAASAAAQRSAHQCPPRPHSSSDSRELIGAVE